MKFALCFVVASCWMAGSLAQTDAPTTAEPTTAAPTTAAETTTTEAPTTSTTPIDFNCTGINAGRFANPLEPCDNIFIVCVDQAAFQFDCATADLRFEESTGDCDFPQFVTACGGNTTLAPPTTPVPTTVAPQVSCANRSVGNFPDPAMDCSQVFFTCAGGTNALPRSCQANTFYDEELDQCLFFNEVPACSGTPRPNATTTAATAAPTTPSMRQFDCTGRSPGNYRDPDNNCSSTFFTCQPGDRSVENTCPGGTFYDAELDRCDFFDGVPECSNTPRTTTDAPPTTQPATPVPFDCSDKHNGNFPSPSMPCSHIFFQCSNGRAFQAECATEALRYSAAEDACLAPVNVEGCEQFEPSNPCAARLNGFYPDAADCTRFFICVDELVFSLNCAPGQVFDDRVKRCLDVSAVPPPCGSAERPPPFSCANRTDGLFPSATDCATFYRCDGGVPSAFACRSGQAFNPANAACEMSALVDGCMPPMDVTLMSFCADQGKDGLFPLEGHCSRAIVCLQQQPFVFICANRLYPAFSPETLSCEAHVDGCIV